MSRRWLAWLLTVSLALMMALPGTAMAAESERGLAGGFREAVFSVRDLDREIRVYREVAGWEVVYRGRAGSDLARFWKLDPDQAIEEALLRNPGTDEGFLRLVQFPGAESRLIRPGAQTWDTGGIFDVNVRVLDIHGKLEALRSHGWLAYGEPVELRFGPFVVHEVLARGPDNIVFALIQRVAPTLEGWPELRDWSRIFNSSQIVADFQGAFDFYVDQLGFQVYLEHHGPSSEPGPNVLGLPHNLTTEIPRKVAILSPRGDNFGSVEILSFEGATGADFSDRAVPPNLGHLTLRFPVADFDAYLESLRARDVELVSGPQELRVEPYGAARGFIVRSPEGAWIEFMELPAVQGGPE